MTCYKVKDMTPDLPFPSLNLNDTITKRNPVGARRFLLQYDKPGEFNLQIDNSSLEVFNACAKSAEYKLVDAREAPPKAALTYGSAVHEGLEVYYREKHLVSNQIRKCDKICSQQRKFPLKSNQFH